MAKELCVHLEVRFGREWVRGCASRGNPLRVRVGRTAVAFAPAEGAARRTPVPVAIYRVASVEKATPLRGRPVVEVNLPRRRPTTIAGLTLGGRSVTLRALDLAIRMQASGRCCITCDGTRACGCAVEMSCGSCCVGECC